MYTALKNDKTKRLSKVIVELSENGTVNSFKDIIIPIVVGIIGFAGATIAVFWNRIERWNKGRIFQDLTLRELEELTPYLTDEKKQEIENKKREMRWTDYYQEKKNYFHKDIFLNPEKNMDFILGLNPCLVYNVKQLWDEITLQNTKDSPNGKQFLHYWNQIELYCYQKGYARLSDIIKTAYKWKQLVYAYQPKLWEELQEKLERECEHKTAHEKMLDKIYRIDSELV